MASKPQYKKIEGLRTYWQGSLTLIKSPNRRTPRSNPATYTEVTRRSEICIQKTSWKYDVAKAVGFNVKGGRCETCRRIRRAHHWNEFSTWCLCGMWNCQGKRFNRENLEIRWRGKLLDVLNMTVDEAVFWNDPKKYVLKKSGKPYRAGLGLYHLGTTKYYTSGG
jgi:excinuclease ABC subunit A